MIYQLSCLEEKWDVQRFHCKNQFNICLTNASFKSVLIWLEKYNSGIFWSTEYYVGGYYCSLTVCQPFLSVKTDFQ